MQLSGLSIIGFQHRPAPGGSDQFAAVNPATGKSFGPTFLSATAPDVEAAARLAWTAFDSYRSVSGKTKGTFLRAIANRIEAIGDELIDRCTQETGLPSARLKGETARTCHQLRLFAEVVEEGSWVMARIDHADLSRTPLPKPDLRSMLRPLGPVAVFGASNFPLAFSVAGGDTASALAAGNPVIVKAHPAHPGTSELVGQAVRDAAHECGMPDGVFSLLFDSGTRVGATLVQDPHVKAVGFTGSFRGGRALMDLASSRPEPIPFYAEMGSTNPVFILPRALREQKQKIASDLHASFTAGSGQFCTKPGVLFLDSGTDSNEFVLALREKVAASTGFTMLTSGIQTAYAGAVAERRTRTSIKSVTEGKSETATGGFSTGAALFETDARGFSTDADLGSEIFGPTTVLVYATPPEMLQAARGLEGHLTATLFATPEDLDEYRELVHILETKVGRLILNSVPTGVEVTHAMVHGGPYPATSDSRTTSVGTQAIFRFARPVCFQGFPDSVLPEELQERNPLGIWRLVDGLMTQDRAEK